MRKASTHADVQKQLKSPPPQRFNLDKAYIAYLQEAAFKAQTHNHTVTQQQFNCCDKATFCVTPLCRSILDYDYKIFPVKQINEQVVFIN